MRAFCDDGGDVARVATCTRQLIDEGVVAMSGPITSPLSLASAASPRVRWTPWLLATE
jgi:hypothetical protein